jgi:hypothetical protein
MRIAFALIAVLALSGCSKKKDKEKADDPAPKVEPGSGSGSAGSAGSAAGSGSAMGSGSATAPVATGPALPEGFSWTPSEDAFTTGNDAANPVAWGDDAEVGLAFGKVDAKKQLPVQIVVVTGGKAEAKQTLSINAPGEVGSFTLAPAGKGKFYVELDLSWSDAAGTHDFLAAVLSKTDKGITVDQSGTWQEIGDDKKKTPKWAADARSHIGEE